MPHKAFPVTHNVSPRRPLASLPSASLLSLFSTCDSKRGEVFRGCCRWESKHEPRAFVNKANSRCWPVQSYPRIGRRNFAYILESRPDHICAPMDVVLLRNIRGCNCRLSMSTVTHRDYVCCECVMLCIFHKHRVNGQLGSLHNRASLLRWAVLHVSLKPTG
jgi:hypothetical protein